MNVISKRFIRIITLLLIILILAGCAENNVSKVKKVKGKIIKDIETYNEEIPGDDPVYSTETEYEYYDDQFTTNPGTWKTDSAGARSVQNISNYSFDESKYKSLSLNGGSDVRKEDFIRGVGASFWNTQGGYNRSPEIKAIDEANLKTLNITSMRTWGEGTNGVVDDSYSRNTSLNVSQVLPESVYLDGSKNGASFQFSDLSAVTKIVSLWIERLKSPAIRKQNKCILIGNEYRPIYLNSSKQWVLSGYDAVTLSRFRNEWLKPRFGTISNLNKKCGTSYSSFSEIIPPQTLENDSALYYEFWLFQRSLFRNVFKDVISKMKSKYSDTAWGYAGYISNTDVYADNLYLDCLDYTSQNLYIGHYNSNFHEWSFQMDNLAAWSKTAPVIVTETGWTSGTTDESKKKTARNYLQSLNLFYMRPRYVGSYIFTYSDLESGDIIANDTTWGLVDGVRNKKPSFDAVSQVYTDFKYLDKFYTGASNTPLVAISNMATDENGKGATNVSRKMAGVLYSQGVPVQVVPSDDAERIKSLKESKLIFNDAALYQSPTGKDDVGEALEKYMKNGGKVLRTVDSLPKSLYGVGNAFTASSVSALKSKYNQLQIKPAAANDQDKLWKVLSGFIHGDFISGKVSVKKNTIDENAARILEVNAYNNGTGVNNPTWDIETKMVYKNGEMYLCLVNIGDEPIDNIDITIGVNNGVLCNLTPRLLRGDNNVSVSKPDRANVPSFVNNAKNAKISFGTLTVSNLDTYAYIYVGKAVTK